MNTTNQKINENLVIATNYYREMLGKNFDAMERYLHPDVLFIGPLAEMSGKAAVVSAAKNLSQILLDIKIRAKFATGEQIMLAYDFMFPEPIATLRSAVLMGFTDHLIAKIELFYDASPFAGKENKIFSKKED